MRRHRTGFLVLLVSLVLISCAGSPEMRVYKGLAITGETLDDAAKHTQAVNALFVQKCTARTLTAAQCNAWIDYGEKFKKVYPHSVAFWKSSRTVSDAVLRKQADEIIGTLLAELVKFGTTVGYDVLFKSEHNERSAPWLLVSLPSSR